MHSLIFLAPHFCISQYNDATHILLRKLDSIQHSSSISRHFGELYFKVTKTAVDYFSQEDELVQNFMKRLELRFADYFFAAAKLYERKKEIPAAWKMYYADTGRTSLQYYLLGANAHINGDIWQVLTNEFSLDELKKYQKYYYRYYKKLTPVLLEIYSKALESISKVRFMNSITLGLDKQYCKQMLKQWRKRQMRISMLWFTDKKQFEKKLPGLQKKMMQFDKLILRHL